MKEAVFHGADDIRIDDVSGRQVHDPTDAVTQAVAPAACATHPYVVRSTVPSA